MAIRLILVIAAALASAQMVPTRLDLRGVMLHYVEEGKGEPLILLHGGQADYRAWPVHTAALAPHFRVISYSRRHHFPNTNPPTADHSARVDADDLAAMIAALKLGPVHLVGTSYGALTALAFALNHPEQVRTLVLAEPPVLEWAKDLTGAADPYRQFMTLHAAAHRSFAAGRDEEAMRMLIDAFDGAGTFDRLPAERRQMVMQNAGFFRVITASSDPFPNFSKDSVRRLDIPALVIRGANTDAMHRIVTEHLASLLPKAQTAVIADAGHGSPRQNPAGFTAAVLQFLKPARP
jgi:pimeloyl-ACP methyl ester carboxylesterase